jgi:saccharopine dehydrogenase-like NADP-dependent oxidoreductase
MEEGAFLVRVEGEKDGKTMTIDTYIGGPGLTEAFEKSGMTHESYFTGQFAFLFTKMFVNDKINMSGVFPPEAFDAEMRTYYMKEAGKLDLTIDKIVEERLS